MKIRINSDKSIESFFDGEWHDVGIAKFNKKNRNFIVSDGSKYFEFGFLSDDGRVLFVGGGIALTKENESIQNIWGSAYSSDDIDKRMQVLKLWRMQIRQRNESEQK